MNKIELMNKIKSMFKDRHFSMDGLIDVVTSIIGLIGFIAILCGVGHLCSKYPEKAFMAFGAAILLSVVMCVCALIFDEIFPKQDPELEKWLNDAKDTIKDLETTKKEIAEITHESN